MKDKETPEEELNKATFHMETFRGLLRIFKLSPGFREHINKAILPIKLKGKSMLKGIKKISNNIF